MKTRKFLLLIMLTGSSLQLVSQVNPVKIDLRNHGIKLDASFFQSDRISKAPVVVLLHGFPGNQSSPLGLAEKLNKAGFNILVFNYQGSYLSEGSFSFDNCIEDVNSAFNFLTNHENQFKYNIDTSKIVVCGYSFGGTIALESGMFNSGIKSIIAIANDDHSVSIKKAAVDMEFRESYRQFVGRSFEPSGPFRGDLKSLLEYNIQNVDRYDLVKNVEKLVTKNVLFIVGWQDKTSLMEINTLPLYRKLEQLNGRKTSIKGFESDHRFNNVINGITDTITDWIIKNTL